LEAAGLLQINRKKITEAKLAIGKAFALSENNGAEDNNDENSDEEDSSDEKDSLFYSVKFFL
jgi:hypothetical protein